MLDVEMQLLAFASLFHHGDPPDRVFARILRVE
jgi:hypothetical protein